MNNFNQLLEQSRQLTNHIVAPSLTPIQRGLEQIEAQTKRLLKRTTTVVDDGNKPPNNATLDSRAAYLLAKQGIDADKVMQTLDQIDLTHTFEPLQGVGDADIDAFLSNEHENIVSLAIEETKEQVCVDTERSFEQRMQRDWQKVTRRIFDEMGHHALADSRSFNINVVPLGGLVASTEGISSHPQLRSFADVVGLMNDARLKRNSFNAVSAFAKVSTGGDASQQLVSRCWDLLANMLGGYSNLNTQSGLNKNDSIIRIKMVRGARQWLQDSYCVWVAQHVRNQHAELGGMPNVDAEVSSLLKLRFCRHNRWTVPWLDLSINGSPFWAHVYTLVRMGLLDTALQYVQSNKQFLTKTDFATYFAAWIKDCRLAKPLRDRLLTEWHGGIRDYLVQDATPKGDIFKHTLFKLIGRCDMGVKSVRNSDVIASTEDYLWLQLMLVDEETDSLYDRFTLSDLSVRMQQFGQSHFRTTPVWFMVLLLCGEYERAVAALLSDGCWAHEGIHFAIAMAYYGALRVAGDAATNSGAGTLLVTKGSQYEVAHLHFAKLIIGFVRNWGQTDPIDCVNYIYLLGLFNNKDYTRLAHQLLSEFVLRTRRFAELLGQVRPDGSGRIPGHIETHRTLVHLDTEQAFLQHIVLASAQEAEKESALQDAIDLYHLAGLYDKVISLLNDNLGERLVQQSFGQEDMFIGAPSQQQRRATTDAALPSLDVGSDPVDATEQLLQYYQSRPLTASSITPQTLSTATMLIDLSRFRTQSEQGRDEAALATLYKLEILPTSTDVLAIQTRVDAFLQLDESVARVMPQIMLTAIQSLYKLFKAWSVDRYGRGDPRVVDVRNRSKALLMFAGLVQYRIPGDIFAKMNRIDVMMG